MAIAYEAATLRSARMDQITTRAGNAALIRFYDSTGTGRPATGGAVTTQQKLAELTLGSPFAAGAASGVLTVTNPTSANALLSGTATWFRIVKADGTTFVLDGNVGTSGSDINFTSVAFVSGQPVNVTSFIVTEGNP